MLSSPHSEACAPASSLMIPFFKPSIGEEEIAEVVETLRSGWHTTGSMTKRFETELSAYIGQDIGVAVNSCTAALHLALEAIGLKAGEAVVVPTMTFAATAEVVRYFGAHPILADCHERDFNIDITDTERRVAEAFSRDQKVVAVIPVHYGGQVGDVEGVRQLAQKYHLKVVEDAAHCCPAFYRAEGGGQGALVHPGGQKVNRSDQAEDYGPHSVGQSWRPVGTGAEITCFSFY